MRNFAVSSFTSLAKVRFDCRSFLLFTFVGLFAVAGHVHAQKLELPARFDYADDFSEGLALIRIGERSFYIDKSGKQVVTPKKYDTYYKFSDGLARVTKDRKWGFIDRTGNLVIGLRFGNADDFSEGVASVSFDPPNLHNFFMGQGKKGLINKAGKFVVNPHLNSIFSASDGYLVVNHGAPGDPTVGIISRSGETLIPPKFEFITKVNEGLAAALHPKGNWSFISPRGEWMVQRRFDALGQLKDGLAVFGECKGEVFRPYDYKKPKDCRFGYVNRLGVTIIPAQFTTADLFSEERAAVSLSVPDRSAGDSAFLTDHSLRYGFIDRDGRLVIDPIYGEVRPFSGGVAAVSLPRKEGELAKWGYIDKNGKPLTDFIYSIAGDVSEGLAAVWTQSGKWGYLRF
jgi:hypothetical protein